MVMGFDTTRVAIPNAAAETLAMFGWVGFVGTYTG